jgi:hypothetical protein
MSSDFLSRVHAEALRRIEAERFEAAVVSEMGAIRREEWKAKQIPLYHAFHEGRKAKLREACEAGRIAPTVAEIETAVSEYALGTLSIDDLYALIEAVDRNYPHTYANSRQAALPRGSVLVGPSRPGVPLKFQLYLESALGVGYESADVKKARFTDASMVAVK